MEFSYTKTLGLGRTIRYDPLISVKLIGDQAIDVYCLVDSGSPFNLISAEFAAAVEIDLSNAQAVEVSGINGKQDGHMKKVSMEFLGKRWESDVIFCERSEDHDLLGSQGFFQYFEVRFRYYEQKFDIIPAPQLQW